jgi:hypothetical protein
MPDVCGVTVVTNACAFYHCARGCGRAERPAFPAPSDWRVRTSWQTSGAFSREIAEACLESVIACDKREAFAQGSAATKIQLSCLLPYGLLRFARNDGRGDGLLRRLRSSQ